MNILSLEDITKADDLERKTIHVPHWDGHVVIQSLTKKQQNDIRKYATVDDDIDEELVELAIVAESVVEPDLSIEHVGLLQNKNGDAVSYIFNEVMKLSALDEEAVARKRMEFQAESGDVDGVSHSEDASDDSAPVEAGDDN